MSSDRLPHKLLAVLHADIAGYTKLTAADPDATHRRLREYLDLVSAVIARHGGRVMHYAGDAVLATFGAVADAIICGIEIQRQIALRNVGLAGDRKLEFRIGINLGDVIEDRGDVYGDGVNVAARLESAAGPGEIWVSESARTAVGKRLQLIFENLGEQTLKNVDQPVRAFRVRAEQSDGRSADPETSVTFPLRHGDGWFGPKVLGASIAGLITVAAVLGISTWGFDSSREPDRVVTRLVVPLEPGMLESTPDASLAYSPDGTRLVYAYDRRLHVHALERLSSTPLAGTEGAAEAFFSPDGQWIGFWQNGQLKRISREGGSPVVLADAPMPWGVDWALNDTLLLGQGPEGIARVTAADGTLVVIIRDPDRLARAPQLLPGGRTVLFTSGPPSFDWNDAQVVAYELDSGQRTVLIRGASNARYVSTGHLVYVARGALMAVPFDPDSLEVTGGPASLDESVAEALGGNTSGEAFFGISNAGFLAYFSPLSSTLSARTLAWVDRFGNEETINAEPRAYIYARVSPDGSRAALDIRDQGNDLWTWGFATERLTRVTRTAGNVRERAPAFSPDGRWLVFDSNRDDGPPNIFLHDLRGDGAEDRLTTSPNNQFAAAFTPDGRYVLFQEGDDQHIDIMLLELDSRRVTPLLQTSFTEVNPRISPNGQWLAYESNESGRLEVHVRPFPEVERSVQTISTGGGTRPVWARSGKELFYVSPAGELISVTFEPESGAIGRPSVLMGASYAWASDFSPPAFDISPDDARFLVIKRNAVREPSAAPGSLIVVSNWFEELRRRAPTRRD